MRLGILGESSGCDQICVSQEIHLFFSWSQVSVCLYCNACSYLSRSVTWVRVETSSSILSALLAVVILVVAPVRLRLRLGL